MQWYPKANDTIRQVHDSRSERVWSRMLKTMARGVNRWGERRGVVYAGCKGVSYRLIDIP